MSAGKPYAMRVVASVSSAEQVARTVEFGAQNASDPTGFGPRRVDDQIRLRSSDRMSDATPTSVYRYYDHNGILIYVGITSRGTKRQAEHNATKEWWEFVARQDVEHFENRADALALERTLIETHTPPFNKQHNRAAAHVRTAYLLFRAAHAQPVKIRDAVRAMQQQLPLDVHEFGTAPNLILRTRLDDALVVAAMNMPDGEAPRVFGLATRKVRKVLRLEKQGPLALIHLGSQSKHPVADAYAVVKFDKSQRLILRNVHVRLDHSDSRLCDRRCPQPRREVRWIRPDGTGRA